MLTAVHIIIIAALGGLIVFILSRVGRRNAPGTSEEAAVRGKKSGSPVLFTVLTLTILATVAFAVYQFMPLGSSAPSAPTAQHPGKGSMPPQNTYVYIPPPSSELDGKPAPPPPPPTAQETQTISALYQKIGPSVVFVMTSKKNNQQGFGSGFFVNYRGDVVTNHHVLRDANSAKIRTSSGTEYEIRSVLAEDVANDLVMVSVKINPGEARPLSVSSAPPSIGERVIVVGSPAGLEQTVTDGIVSALGRTFMGTGKFTQITAPISPGSSGSPVVNMKGEVIGVASGTYVANHAQNINFCSAAENITALSPGNGYSLGKMDKPAWAIAAEKRKSEEEDRIRQQQQRQKMIADIHTMTDQAYTRATAGDNQTAFQLYEKCLSLCRQIEDNKCIGTYLRNMGIILERMGRRDEAQLYYIKASEALAKN